MARGTSRHYTGLRVRWRIGQVGPVTPRPRGVVVKTSKDPLEFHVALSMSGEYPPGAGSRGALTPPRGRVGGSGSLGTDVGVLGSPRDTNGPRRCHASLLSRSLSIVVPVEIELPRVGFDGPQTQGLVPDIVEGNDRDG